MIKSQGFVILVCALVLVGGCGSGQKHSDTSATKASIPVRVTRVEKLGELSYSELLGTIEARRQVTIQTKIQARIEQIRVGIGSHVREGDLLVEFDTRETSARVKQSRAVYEQAQQDLKRFETLLSQGAATQQEYDGAKARSAVAEATLQEAEAELTYARITAPISGTITRRDINEGDFAVPGRPLLAIEDESSLRLIVSLPESLRAHLNIGDSLGVSLAAGGDQVAAVVEELSPSADPISRSLTAKLSLANDGRMHSGQIAHLLLPGNGGAGLAVASNTVVQRGQLEFVYALSENGTASLKLVRTGRALDDKTEILSGLVGDEQVIVEPPAGLEDHDPVEVQR